MIHLKTPSSMIPHLDGVHVSTLSWLRRNYSCWEVPTLSHYGSFAAKFVLWPTHRVSKISELQVTAFCPKIGEHRIPWFSLWKSNMAAENPYECGFIAKKITNFYGPFSTTLNLILRGHHSSLLSNEKFRHPLGSSGFLPHTQTDGDLVMRSLEQWQWWYSIYTRWSPRTRMPTHMFLAQISKHISRSKGYRFNVKCWMSIVKCKVWDVECEVCSVKYGV